MRDRAYWAKLLPVIQAWIAGKPIQYRNKASGFGWIDADRHLAYPGWLEDVEYRIKPETLQYRKFLYKTDNQLYIGICHNVVGALSAQQREEAPFFIKWIDTEWQEIELPSSTETGG